MKHSLRFFGNFLGLNFQTLFKIPFLTEKNLRVVDTFVAKRVGPTIQDNVPYCPSSVMETYIVFTEINFEEKIVKLKFTKLKLYNVMSFKDKPLQSLLAVLCHVI